MTKFFTKYIDHDTPLPKKELLSSVFLIAINGTKILAIKNERGWDIPGGHIEQGETPEEALIREVEEEAGASFSNARLFAIVASDHQGKYKDKIMLMYTTNNFKLGKFTQSEDAFDREVIEIKEFLEKYKDGFDFSSLIKHAQKINCDLIK